jgi:hypothetical protein
MSTSVVKLNALMRVGDLYDTVANTKHNIFPVERPGDRNFQGTINRHRIAVLLRDLAFGEKMEEADFQTVRCSGFTMDSVVLGLTPLGCGLHGARVSPWILPC